MKQKMLAIACGFCCVSFVWSSNSLATVQKLNEAGSKVGVENLGDCICSSLHQLQQISWQTDEAQLWETLKKFEEYSSYFPKLADCGVLDANGDRNSIYRQVMGLRWLLCYPYSSGTLPMKERIATVISSQQMIRDGLNCLEKEEETPE